MMTKYLLPALGKLFAAGALLLLVVPGSASASVRAAAYSVNDYSYVGLTNLQNSISNGQGLLNSLAPNFYYSQWEFDNASVYDFYFVDTERVPGKADDTDYFDRLTYVSCSWFGCSYEYGTGLSYYTGRGALDDGWPIGVTEVTCNSAADCTKPPPGYYFPGQCRSWPAAAGGTVNHCRYNQHRKVQTSSYAARFANRVNTDSNYICLGESPNAGGWKNCSTNGSVNIVVFDMNHGTMPKLWATHWGRMFAGVHAILGLMTISGNDGDGAFSTPDRGATYMGQNDANPNIAVVDAWAQALNDVNQTDGAPCAPATGNMDYNRGGGHGFNGCGCNTGMVTDTTVATSNNRVSQESFSWAVNDGYDVTGAVAYNVKWLCNYDSGTFGFTK